MKLLKSVLVTVLTVSTFAANANMKTESSYRFAGDLQYAGFCKAVVEDDVNLLKRSLRSKVGFVGSSSKDVLRKIIAQDGMKCDGTDLVEFSKQRKANEVHAFLTAQRS